MRILFIGGTGLISSAVTPLALERGMDLTLVTRGQSTRADVPTGALTIQADARNPQSLRAALHDDVATHGRYDAVVQWICFTPDHLRADIETFAGLTDQYVFISSASAYDTPPPHYIAREATTALNNPFWQYSRDKAECERVLREEGTAAGLGFTIVRPSHTYGYSDIPFAITSGSHPWTVAERIRQGRPVIMHGDGTSLWTLTDHRDFAVGLVGLLGHPRALGEDFHITSDDVLSWNQIHGHIAAALGVDQAALDEQTVFIPSTTLARFDRDAFEGPLLGDKANAGVFDNSKLRAVVPDYAPTRRFADGIHEAVAWFEADESRRGVDEQANALWDRVISAYQGAVDAAIAQANG